MAEFVLDGRRFNNFAEFVAEINRACGSSLQGRVWDGEDFNDLDEYLKGASPVSIRWTYSKESKDNLGYEEMREFWEETLRICLREIPWLKKMQEEFKERIEEASSNKGRTLFEYLFQQLERSNFKIVLE